MRKNIIILILIFYGLLSFSEPPKSVPKVHKDCLSTCHKPHNADGMSLTKEKRLDKLCLKCHNSNDPAKRMETKQLDIDIGYVSSHIDYREEKIKSPYIKEFSINGKKYFLKDDCSGCHNPHLTNGEILHSFSFNTEGKIQSERRRFVGELCLGCHSGVESAITKNGMSDIGILVSPVARSKHRIGDQISRRRDINSLKEIQLSIDCLSCHTPHFSKYPSLLVAPFYKEFEMTSEEDSSTLCFNCHSRDLIYSNNSFSLHKEHITGIFNLNILDEAKIAKRRMESFYFPKRKFPEPNQFDLTRGFGKPTSCATCHNPHGSIENPYLIDFDKNVVFYSSTGRIEYRRTGLHKGYCTLKCHDYDHIESEY